MTFSSHNYRPLQVLLLMVLWLAALSPIVAEASVQEITVEVDTLRNGVSDYIGVGSHTLGYSDGLPSTGNISSGTDLHFGLQYMRYLPGRFYILVKGNISRYLNKYQDSTTVFSTMIVGDTLVREQIGRSYNLSNDYLNADAAIGVGKVVKLNKSWSLDINAAVAYRFAILANADFVNPETNEQESLPTTGLVDPTGDIHITGEAGLRWNIDKESYFLFAISHQAGRSLTITTPANTTTMQYSATYLKVGYGFDF